MSDSPETMKQHYDCANCLNKDTHYCFACDSGSLHQPRLRPEVTNQIISRITKQLDKQNDKGLKKYGVTVDHMTGYDYNVMALEEMADALQYLMKENMNLKHENELLRKSLQDIQGD